MNTTLSMPPLEDILPEGKEWYTTKEAAIVLGRSAQYVRDCFDSQKLLGYALNARGTRGKEQRKSLQISRASLIVYLLEAANFRPGDFAERVRELVNRLTPEEKRALANDLLPSPQRSIWDR